MQSIADLITDAYRQKGFVTSRAYLPPQKIDQGVLLIKVIEGLTGKIEVKGSRHFKTSLLRRKIALKEGDLLNFNILRKGLNEINDHPDRTARAVLVPGTDSGTTDIVIEVKERLPVHIGFGWDNLGSQYIDKQRYDTRFEHNNLLGFDDRLMLEYQLAQADRYVFKYMRYVVPVADWELGMVADQSKVKLGKELEDADLRGESELYGFFVAKSLIRTDRFNLNINAGFDYKNATNTEAGNVSSEDLLRVAKTGLDMYEVDTQGRTLFVYELGCGIPGLWGGLEEQSTTSSRSGAGGEFLKHSFNLLRLQKMFFSSVLLWKNQSQVSSDVLTSTEQFQLGGVANVRGYPAAEAVGDSGYSTTWEWSCPLYGLSKNIRVPFSKASFYDAIRLALFYDWGFAHLKNPLATEQENSTLRSLGCGVSFNLPEDLSFRTDFAWPLGETPSDGDNLHILMQFSKNF